MSQHLSTSSQENDRLMDFIVGKGLLEEEFSKDVSISSSCLDKSWPSMPSGRRSPCTDTFDEYSPPTKSAKIGGVSDLTYDFNPNSPFYDASSDSDEPRIIIDEKLCYVCSKPELTTQNYFVECMNCQNFCHQHCASPPINADLCDPDPEFVWYCEYCITEGSKIVELVNSSSSQSSLGSSCASTVRLSPRPNVRLCSRLPIYNSQRSMINDDFSNSQYSSGKGSHKSVADSEEINVEDFKEEVTIPENNTRNI